WVLPRCAGHDCRKTAREIPAAGPGRECAAVLQTGLSLPVLSLYMRKRGTARQQVLRLGDVEPRQAFLRKILPPRLKPRGLIERTDMEMRFRRPGETFARQRGPAPGAKSAPRSPWRRIDLGDLAFGHGISLAGECHEDRNRRARMPATTLAMTPIYPFRFTSGDKTDRPAQAATFKLLGRAAHD